ncbi:hypothetical protein MKW92_023738 [Papaver armeniacum]|nr:hypothetical protein MKW92_023738 [Papaver armeniacum]
MATAALLGAISFGKASKFSGNLNPSLNTFPTTQIHFQSIRKNTSFLIKKTEVTSKFKVNCFVKPSKGFQKTEEKQERKINPFDDIIQVLTKFVLENIIQKTAIAAVILGLLLTCNPHSALGASGGRIGGSNFSSDSSSSYSSSYSSSSSSYSSTSSSSTVGDNILLIIYLGKVALLGTARSLQKDLDKLAEVADTLTPSGLRHILQEATVAVLRNPNYWVSCYSIVDVKHNKEDGEKRFNQLSIEERTKIDEETLVNVDGIKRRSTTRKRAGSGNEYIVMTVLVAAKGVHKICAINSSANLKEALQKLGSMPISKILAVEALWTPQVENDTLTEREMLQNYPNLRPLS